MAAKLDLADIGPIAKNRMQRASWKLGRIRTEHATFFREFLRETVERVIIKGKEFKDAADVGAGLRIDFHDSASVLAEVAVAVTDPIKDSTPEAVKTLHELGLRIIMLTGDNDYWRQGKDGEDRGRETGH